MLYSRTTSPRRTASGTAGGSPERFFRSRTRWETHPMKRADVLKHVILGSVLCLIAACAGPSQLRMTRSASVPAAVGIVDVSTTDNGNTAVRLTVEHLAPADRISAGAKTYMVWARGLARGDAAQAMGALAIDSDLKGEIR